MHNPFSEEEGDDEDDDDGGGDDLSGEDVGDDETVSQRKVRIEGENRRSESGTDSKNPVAFGSTAASEVIPHVQFVSELPAALVQIFCARSRKTAAAEIR